MAPIRIVIAARGRGARAAIRAVLDSERACVVGEAEGRWRAGELVRGVDPDVVIADISVLATHEFFLRSWGPVPRDTPIVAVGPDDPHLAGMLVAHGAAAYVATSRLAEELPGALEELALAPALSRNGA